MAADPSDGTRSPAPDRLRVPASAWLRPALLLVGGLLVAALLFAIDQRLAAVAMALFALLMGYWTSPLRSGQHVPLARALAARGPGDSVILWAPGDPMSARLQTAIRSTRTDVAWVNVYRDAEAAQLLARHGGRAALPLVLLGDGTELRRASVGAFLDASAAAQEAAGRRAGTDGPDPDAALDDR